MKKRLLSMLLAIVMVVGLMPGFAITASAAEMILKEPKLTTDKHDINGDGIIEVPSEEFLPNISDDNTTNIGNLGQSLINWVRITEDKAEIVDRHIIMSQYGYRFRFSEKWLGNVSVSNDPQKRILTFWSVENSDGRIVKSKKLFSVMTITEIDLDTIGEFSFTTYSQLMQLKDKLYYSRIYDAGVDYGITKKEIKQRIIAG